jgi:hypothetical protein
MIGIKYLGKKSLLLNMYGIKIIATITSNFTNAKIIREEEPPVILFPKTKVMQIKVIANDNFDIRYKKSKEKTWVGTKGRASNKLNQIAGKFTKLTPNCSGESSNKFK